MGALRYDLIAEGLAQQRDPFVGVVVRAFEPNVSDELQNFDQIGGYVFGMGLFLQFGDRLLQHAQEINVGLGLLDVTFDLLKQDHELAHVGRLDHHQDVADVFD